MKPTPTVGEYSENWIPGKIEPLFGRSLVRDYNLHFGAHVLPKFKGVRLLALGTADLNGFRIELLAKGLASRRPGTSLTALSEHYIAMHEPKLKSLRGETSS